MNTLLTFLSIFWTASLTSNLGWARPVAPAPGVAYITGHITNSTSDTIAVSFRANQFEANEQTTYARIGAKGEFQLQVPVTGAVHADLVYGEAVVDLYLDAATDLDVRFKGEDMPGSIKFKAGTTSATAAADPDHRQQMVNANAYLAEFDAQFVANEDYQVLPGNIMLYEKPFLSFIDYRLKHELSFLEDHAAKQALTLDFYNYAKSEITYSNLNDRLTYPDLREQMVTSESRLKLSAGYYEFLNASALLADQSATTCDQYQEFLLNYVHYQAGQLSHKRTDADYLVVCYMTAFRRLGGDARLATLGRILQESFRFGHVQQSAAMLAEYCTLDTKKVYATALQASFEQHRTLALGAQAPEFELTSAAGEQVKLSQYRGKLVYLNFWKTNNPLCQRDLPYAQDLTKRFEGKDVVFINIALDDQHDPWKQLVDGKQLPGVHLHAAGGMQAAVAQAYKVSSMPAYVLLGEDGTILSTKPKGLGSRAAVEEINGSFGKAGNYSAALALLSSTASTK